MTLSIAEAHVLQDLRRRVEALECTLAGRQMSGLQRHNADKSARALQLRQAIRQVMEASPEPARLTSKHVLRALGYPDIAARTVRAHMREIRGDTCVPPPESLNSGTM